MDNICPNCGQETLIVEEEMDGVVVLVCTTCGYSDSERV